MSSYKEEEPKSESFEEIRLLAKETLKKYRSKLGPILPIDDVVFNCLLVVEEVFTQDELDAIQLMTPDNGIYNYLDYIIESQNVESYLCNLLTAIKEFGGSDNELLNLAKEIGDEAKICTCEEEFVESLDECDGFIGVDYVGQAAEQYIKRAICLIKTPSKKNDGKMDVANGFLGYVKLHEHFSVVLVTSYHAFGDEEVVANSLVRFDDVDIPLNQLMVEKSCFSSNKKKLDFSMVEIDWNSLKSINKQVEYIDLTKSLPVKSDDHITVIQHCYTNSGDMYYSSSKCSAVDSLLIYECGQVCTISGGLVLKAVDGKFVPVGLHRGKFKRDYNCGTKLSDILKNISGKQYNADVKSQAKAKIADTKCLGPVREGRGCSSVSEGVRRKAKRAVCLIKTIDQNGKKVSYGTGFIGFVQLRDKSSVVLVTNYHVIGNERMAEESLLQFEGVNAQLHLKELLIKSTYKYNDINMLDFAMVEIDWKKLKQEHPDVEYIDLTKPATIENHDYITIIQHPAGGELSFSYSTYVVYKYFLLYECQTAHGSSGGPILKATTTNGLEIVGLHRGGCEDHYNYGSKFSEILLSISGQNDHDKQNLDPKHPFIKDRFRRKSTKKKQS